jgi:ArsR family transcriptional regulator, virulence genes transcriptional regulator
MVNQRLYELHASICKALSHPKRLEILDCLRAGEMNVKDLTEALGVSQSTLSRFLRSIHSTGIISHRRDGQNVYYRLSDPRVIEACDAMRDVLLQILEAGAMLSEAIQ